MSDEPSKAPEYLLNRQLETLNGLRLRFPDMVAVHIKTQKSYTIICVALRESSLEPEVVYRDSRGLTWIRPYAEFCQKFEADTRGIISF